MLTYLGLTRTPIGFIPVQDKGYLLVSFQLPDAASVQRTGAVMAQIDDIVLGPVAADGKRDRAKGIPGCAHTVGIGGYSVLLGAGASNFGTMFITLAPFEERAGNMQEYGLVVMQKVQAAVRREVQDATVGVFPPPPVDGLGSGGGWKLMVEDRGDVGLEALQQNTDALIKKVVESPGAGVAFTQFRANTPQLYADVDRTKAKQLGVKLSDVFSTLQVYLGGQYVNDFNKFGRTWQVNLQADAPYRMTAEYVRNLRVRNDRGEMVPLGAVATIEEVAGPLFVQRYNLYPAAAINGNLPPTTSSGQGIALVDAAAAEVLPRQFNPQWTELFYLQQLEGNSAIFAFLGAVVLVYLVLAAQYESWTLPLAIILVVPMCLLSAIAGVRLAGLSIDIFVQVGFIVLVGLAAKNAILVVEFAQQQRMLGLNLWDATLKSVRLRLRPIVMTSFAFILGVVPLVLAEGAGMEMRKTLGIAVFSGMLGVTLFGLVLTPVFYYVIEKYTTGTGPVKPHGHAPIQPIRAKEGEPSHS